MNKEQGVIDRIMSDVAGATQFLLQDANQRVTASINFVKVQLENERKTAIEEVKTALKTEKAYLEKTADLDERREKLEERRAIIDGVFEDVKKELQSMKEKEYKALVAKIKLKHAKKGDVILDTKKNGIIIQSKNYDKNFTFDKLLEILRADIETEVAGILFG